MSSHAKCKWLKMNKFFSDMLIGRDILKQGNLSVTSKNCGVKSNVRKVFEKRKSDIFSEFEQMCAFVEEFSACSDVTHIKDKVVRKEISRLERDYNPVRPKVSMVNMGIILTDKIPVHQPPRRLAPLEQDFVRKQVGEWINEGIVRPSYSDFASPVVLASKKDGSFRLCVDYRAVNNKLRRIGIRCQ